MKAVIYNRVPSRRKGDLNLKSQHKRTGFHFWNEGKYLYWNLEQSMGARNLEGTGLSYRPARLQKLAESIP
jgi:hypothetical protein